MFISICSWPVSTLWSAVNLDICCVSRLQPNPLLLYAKKRKHKQMAHNNVPRTRGMHHAVTLETHREIKKQSILFLSTVILISFTSDEDMRRLSLKFELWMQVRFDSMSKG